jgi:hypothetical protein
LALCLGDCGSVLTLIPQNPQPSQKREINHLRRNIRAKAGKAASTVRPQPTFSHPSPSLQYSTTPPLHFPYGFQAPLGPLPPFKISGNKRKQPEINGNTGLLSAFFYSTLIPQNPQPRQTRDINHLHRSKRRATGKGVNNHRRDAGLRPAALPISVHQYPSAVKRQLPFLAS